jgi:hypothetical protein
MGISQDATAPQPALPAAKPTTTAKGLPPYVPPVPAAAPTPAPEPPKQPDSVELLRKRTGTPQLGVPVVPSASSASEVLHQSSVTGVIEPKPETRARVRPPTPAPADSVPADRERNVASLRGKRPTQDPGISQSWYDEGDRESDESGTHRRRAKSKSSSTTDLSLYDDVPRSNRTGVIVGLIGVAVVVGGIAFAVTRGGDEPKPTQPAPTPVAGATIDAGPSALSSRPRNPLPHRRCSPTIHLHPPSPIAAARDRRARPRRDRPVRSATARASSMTRSVTD